MASHDVPRATRPRTEAERQQELDKIDKYRSLEHQFRQQIASSQFDLETLQLTAKLLRLNPEYYTAWNVRRRCLISGPLFNPPDGQTEQKTLQNYLANVSQTAFSAESLFSSSNESRLAPEAQTDRSSTQGAHRTVNKERNPNETEVHELIQSELVFIVPLLMQHPKCYWIWNYRMWILHQAIELLHFTVAKNIWEEELTLVGKMLHKDRRNYHAWAYRRHVVGQLESSSLAGQSLVEDEFQYTTKMIKVDLSNFSAWHNRSQLICRLLDERASDDDVRRKLLDDEFELVRDGLNVGPEDQSLWYYHQFLMSNLVEKDDRTSMVPRLTIYERSSCIKREIDAIKELLEDYDDIKWIYEALIDYTITVRQLDNCSSGERESGGVAQWLRKLRELDPMRNGRWDDLAKEVGLE